MTEWVNLDPLAHIQRHGTPETWCGIDARTVPVAMTSPELATCSTCHNRWALARLREAGLLERGPYIPLPGQEQPPVRPEPEELPQWESRMVGGTEVCQVLMGVTQPEVCRECLFPDPALIGPASRAGNRLCHYCTRLGAERDKARMAARDREAQQFARAELNHRMMAVRRRQLVFLRLVLFLCGVAMVLASAHSENTAGLVLDVTGALMVLASVAGRARR